MPNKSDLKEPTKGEYSKSERNQRDKALAQKARGGDTHAREALIVEHMYLVDRLIGFFVGKGVPRDVLYQEGCYGLILAVDRFDPTRKVALDTYASYYVNKYLWQAMLDNHPHPVILKQKSAKWCKRYKETAELLTKKLGRYPSNQEIADELGIPYQSAASLMFVSMQAYSIDAAEDDEDRPSIATSTRAAEDEAISSLNEMCLDAFQANLSPTEEEILFLRFGFGPNGRPHSFIEIGSMLGFSPDTISSYYSIAIEKLRESKKFS